MHGILKQKNILVQLRLKIKYFKRHLLTKYFCSSVPCMFTQKYILARLINPENEALKKNCKLNTFVSLLCMKQNLGNFKPEKAFKRNLFTNILFLDDLDSKNQAF